MLMKVELTGATELVRGNEMLLAYMERIAKASDAAMERGDYHETAFGAHAMQCLHSELRKSVVNVPQCVGDDCLTDDNCRKLCARMVQLAQEANITRGASYAMYQLQGAEIALECLGIPYNVDFDSVLCKRTSVTVGGVTMGVDSSE